MLVKNGQSDNVRGQQIGRKLDALKNTFERPRQRVGQSRFTDTGNVLDQQMSARNQGDDSEADGFRLSFDDSLDRLLQSLDLFRCPGAR